MSASGPIGNVALGDFMAEFVEGIDDAAVRCAIEEHLVDQVALAFGKGGDEAVAAALGFGHGSGRWRCDFWRRRCVLIRVHKVCVVVRSQ